MRLEAERPWLMETHHAVGSIGDPSESGAFLSREKCFVDGKLRVRQAMRRRLPPEARHLPIGEPGRLILLEARVRRKHCRTQWRNAPADRTRWVAEVAARGVPIGVHCTILGRGAKANCVAP